MYAVLFAENKEIQYYINSKITDKKLLSRQRSWIKNLAHNNDFSVFLKVVCDINMNDD